MVLLGFPDTTHVTLDHMIHHVEATARGVKNALLAVSYTHLGKKPRPAAKVPK